MNKTALILCGLGLAAWSATAKDRISDATLANLQASYNGESNAHARYLAFADQADKEGYAGAASLFRAAAKSEQIHAANHAAVIKQFGGAPQAKMLLPTVGTTRENLAAAIKGESYERDEMYPAFIRTAKSESAFEAVQTFNYAIAAEVEHAKLYTQTLASLDDMTSTRTFYVCPVCGFTTADPELQYCPTTGTPKERFEEVS